jgi:Arylsulfotransferase (ASST)/Bacterial Ig-like domain
MKRYTSILLALTVIAFGGVARPGQASVAVAPAILRYLAPPDGGHFVPTGSTVALRLDGQIDPPTLSPALFTVTGSVSGRHSGQALLAADGATVIFKPAAPFAAGETVTVAVGPGLKTQTGAAFGGLRSSFGIAPRVADPKAVEQALAEVESPVPLGASAAPSTPAAVNGHPQDYVTFPDDFPAYTVTVPATNTAPGLLFSAPFPVLTGGPSELFIYDDTGEPVYWKEMPPGAQGYDFKVQPDGHLTYFSGADNKFHVLDNTYTEVKSVGAANGYTADLHDFQILPNGDALFLIYDPQPVDMSQIITGGVPTATVVGLVIQELDPSNLPVFQWSSWDHFLITDTVGSLTTPVVDYVHGNSIARDYDGNLLLSSRNLSEITKIDREGRIMWRLGGKNNQFTIHDTEAPFALQHDLRRLPNGNLTFFDNHGLGPFSRAVEYQIDENAKVVTNTWQYHNSPDDYALAMGNTQRLPDGHTLIGWGFGHPNVTEVLTDGTKVFEMAFDPHYQSYRTFRFPWMAVPSWDPTLVLTGTLTPTLYYSWNGATDVASYEIYGGFGSAPSVLLGTQPRTGFEDHTELAGVPSAFCSFRVRPIDHEGQPQRFSSVVYTRTPCTDYNSFLPVIGGP